MPNVMGALDRALGSGQVSLKDVHKRYREAFGEPAPLLFWGGSKERLVVILEEAIRTGKKVTQDDLLRAQGATEPAPDDAIY
jgi:hypothetical protein